jgi:cytoskeletal protein CcmA (bactofilin family)
MQQQKIANVGQSVHIKGELTGKEDLTIEGTVEGRISLPANSLTVGTNGRVAAEIHAKTVEVLGQVQGNIVAVDMVTIAPSGSVQGDIQSPRVAIADGARFRGAIDMESRGAASTASANAAMAQQRPARPEPPKVAAAVAS